MFMEGDVIVGVDAEKLFDFLDGLLEDDPDLDDSELVEEVSAEYDLDYEDSLEAVAQYNTHLDEEEDFYGDENEECQ